LLCAKTNATYTTYKQMNIIDIGISIVPLISVEYSKTNKADSKNKQSRMKNHLFILISSGELKMT
jgi:hypothetical protein